MAEIIERSPGVYEGVAADFNPEQAYLGRMTVSEGVFLRQRPPTYDLMSVTIEYPSVTVVVDGQDKLLSSISSSADFFHSRPRPYSSVLDFPRADYVRYRDMLSVEAALRDEWYPQHDDDFRAVADQTGNLMGVKSEVFGDDGLTMHVRSAVAIAYAKLVEGRKAAVDDIGGYCTNTEGIYGPLWVADYVAPHTNDTAESKAELALAKLCGVADPGKSAYNRWGEHRSELVGMPRLEAVVTGMNNELTRLASPPGLLRIFCEMPVHAG